MKRHKPITALIALALTAIVLAGCGDDDGNDATAKTSSPASAGSSITIDNFKFSPSTLTVSAGAKVTASNDDSTAHTVTANDGSFDTEGISDGSSKSFSAPKPGSYAYHCEIHPFMHGTLVVKG